MSESTKRKLASTDGGGTRGGKRSKGGSGGKWQTPHHKAKLASHGGGRKIEAGDMGIWATCIKGREGKATEELKVLFAEHAEQMYGIDLSGPEHEDADDIEASIQQEVDAMARRRGRQQQQEEEGPAQLFTAVYLEVPCVLFFRTLPPVVPVSFVRRICEAARDEPGGRRMRFVNRLTPMTAMGKATEKGLEEVGRLVLAEHFQLAGAATRGEGESEGDHPGSYAIRPTIRNHKTLQRDSVIQLVASLVGSQHRVDLTKPDKVIIVEIYQNVCGMSVVGGDWEGLKRYNLAEIYLPSPKPAVPAVAKPEGVKEGETSGSGTCT